MNINVIPHRIKVSTVHELQIYEIGQEGGTPIVFLHGGPGGGIVETHFNLFDSNRQHVILFDQRGCGKSTPQLSLKENTTWDLVEDIEKIRKYFNLPSWTVVGGSWGSTLGYAYLGAYPDSVDGAVFWGSTEFSPEEIFEMSRVFPLYFPDQWDNYLKHGGHKDHEKIIEVECGELLCADESRAKAALDRTSTLWRNGQTLVEDTPQFADATKKAIFLTFSHYALHNAFFDKSNLPSLKTYNLKNKVVKILHGRQDMRCFASTAFKLHRAIKGSTLRIIPGAGHGVMDPAMLSEIKSAVRG